MKLKLLNASIAAAIGSMYPMMAMTQEASQQSASEIEEVMILGSRTLGRSSADLPVPVDVISSEEFSSVGGGADIVDNLNALVPSYTAAPATGDGSSFVRPTSLRGMASDQTLVLVNGKRRHRSALVQLYAPAANNGSHGTDIGMIPSGALKQVEVLRDGAASQYGSDAIAGVINFTLDDADEGGTYSARYGQHYEGENSWLVSLNQGFSLNDKGFANITFETNDNEALSRGVQHYDAEKLINDGVQGVGADAQFGESPLAQTWGRPESSGIRTTYNLGYDLSDSTEAYLFGNYAKTTATTRFFYRSPKNEDKKAEIDATIAKGATNLDDVQRVGYTPYFVGDQLDYSVVTGLKGELSEDTTFDLAVSTGFNSLDYTLKNSLNGAAPLIGDQAQRDFDPGGYEQLEYNVTLDMSTTVYDGLAISYGLEWREEEFTQKAGERSSYLGSGSQGYRGMSPENAGTWSRDNWATYVDIEQDLAEDWLVQYALRYENFSDFGDTANWKVATRYNLTEDIALRAAVSTGFHAPTPGQSNLRNTTSSFSGNQQVDIGLLPTDDPEVLALGGKPLKEEESFNVSIGLTANIGEATTLTIDGYKIAVDDRIYRTESEVKEDVSFYTNALSVEHQGVDLVLTTPHTWTDEIATDFTLSWGYNEVSVTDNKLIDGKQVVSDDLVEDIETNYPNTKWTLGSNTEFSVLGAPLNLMVRARYIGEHDDERGNRAGTAKTGYQQTVSPVTYVDLELSYQVEDNFEVAFGGSNIFDEYPDELKDETGQANRMSVGLPYPRRSVAGYEGGSWYLKGTYTF